MSKPELYMESAGLTGARVKLVLAIFDCMLGMFNVVREQYREVARETGLSYSQTCALKEIANSAPLRVSSLARKMCIHPATIVGILDHLEERQLITRTRSYEDRRVVYVDLTEEARKIVISMPEVFHNRIIDGFNGVEDGDLVTMLASLKQLSELLEAHYTNREASSCCLKKHKTQDKRKTKG